MAKATSKSPAQGLFLKRQIVILIIALVFIAIAVGALVVSGITNSRQEKWHTLLNSTDSSAQVLDRMVRTRAAGDTISFYRTRSNVENLDREIRAMQKGAPKTGTPPLPAAVAPELKTLVKVWQPLSQDAAQAMHDTAPFNKTLQSINDAATKLGRPYQKIAKALGVNTGSSGGGSGNENSLIEALTGGAPPKQAAPTATGDAGTAQQLLKLSRYIAGSSSTSGGAGAITPTARAKTLHERIQKLASLNNRLANSYNPPVAKLARSVTDTIAALTAAANQLVSQARTLDATLRTTNAMFLYNSPSLRPSISTLALALQKHNLATNKTLRIVAYGAGALALILLIVFAILFATAQIRLRRAAERKDAAQQDAILRLLDEITNLSEGDLTGDMTVTEDFTGAIADSLNYTIETLRELVGTINKTSAGVASAAARTTATARQMSEDSDQQAHDISAVATTMSESSQQLQSVSGQAQQLAEQANSSVETAHNGAQTVDQTINSMSALRDQIQDTAKRIKRLGESSQEIGNITEVINDIAEQTNTLALNASIQAAMAGESGRGFAVVAGEVQRLAERATTATRRIETLIKTIQTDTNEAIVSMEHSTTNVVSGARSAEEAGRALGRIETASQELALTITSISEAARGQSEAATQTAQRMQSIRQIAVGTSQSATQTARETGDLNTLSDQLRESVAGFKLPESAIAAVDAEADTDVEPPRAAGVASG